MMRLQNCLSELIVSAGIDLGDLIRFALFELSFKNKNVCTFPEPVLEEIQLRTIITWSKENGVERPIKPELRHYEVKYCCILGAKMFKVSDGVRLSPVL